MPDIAVTFDAHVQAELQDLDLEATMATMSSDPYVHHVPTITGGNGTEAVREFYGHHFIGQWPDDTETHQISRTVGENQVVDELLMTFTHDRELEIMLPGVPPTGRRITIPVVVVVGFEDSKVHHEHIYWDQASVLVQAGILDPAGLPTTGAEQAESLIDQGGQRTRCSARTPDSPPRVRRSRGVHFATSGESNSAIAQLLQVWTGWVRFSHGSAISRMGGHQWAFAAADFWEESQARRCFRAEDAAVLHIGSGAS